MRTSITPDIFPLNEKFQFSLVYRPAFFDFDWSVLVLHVVAGRIFLYDEMSHCIALARVAMPFPSLCLLGFSLTDEFFR